MLTSQVLVLPAISPTSSPHLHFAMFSAYYIALVVAAAAAVFSPGKTFALSVTSNTTHHAPASIVHAQSGVANCDREYTVQPGDFCDKISAAQNVSTSVVEPIMIGTIESVNGS